MAKLDYNYIESLVDMAKHHDSNAFAELFAATYQLQYEYAYLYLGDEYLAKYALQETYIKALRDIGGLNDAKLFVPWLNQQNFRVCFAISQTSADNADINTSKPVSTEPENAVITIDGHDFRIRNIFGLPFSEAQALICRYYNNMNVGEIAKLMDMSRSSIRRALRNGQQHLFSLIGQGGEE